MGKPIAGSYQLPFGITGMKVNGVKLQGGTVIKDLRIIKQRSNSRFDLLDPATNTVHRKVTITGSDSTGKVLPNDSTDDEVLVLINESTFFIRTIDTSDDSTVGYCVKFLLNAVHLSNDITFYVPDYSIFYVPMPEPEVPSFELDGAQVAFHKVGKPNELMVGSGNSNKSMVIATDGIIELAMAARLWQPTGTGAYNSIVEPVDGVYTIALDKSKNQEYTLPFSIGIVSPEFIGKITDLYSVTMTYYGSPNGIMDDNYISWRLEYINGKYVMKDYRYGRDITDSAVNPSLTAIQNIERYKFFNMYLEIDPPPGEIPTGKYIGTIVARHIVTGDVITLEVMLDASYI